MAKEGIVRVKKQEFTRSRCRAQFRIRRVDFIVPLQHVLTSRQETGDHNLGVRKYTMDFGDHSPDSPIDIARRTAEIIGADKYHDFSGCLTVPVRDLKPPEDMLRAIATESGIDDGRSKDFPKARLAPAFHY